MIKAEVDGSGGLGLEVVGFSGMEGEAAVGVPGVEAVLSVHSSTAPLRAFFFFVMVEASSDDVLNAEKFKVIIFRSLLLNSIMKPKVARSLPRIRQSFQVVTTKYFTCTYISYLSL